MSRPTSPSLKNAVKLGDVVSLKIDSIAFPSGNGVGRLDGMVVFVPFSAPGDTLKAKITSLKKDFAEGHLLELISPSDQRTQPLCPVFSQCGGCQLQHLNYQTQLEAKWNNLRRCFRGIHDTVDFEPAIDFWRYRNRIQLQVQDGKLGYFQKNSQQLVAIEDCWLAPEPIISKFADVLRDFPKGRHKIEVFQSIDGSIGYRDVRDEDHEGLFGQVNTAMNDKLIESVLKLVTDEEHTQLLDLYCGQGNFTLPLARRLKSTKIIGVDWSDENIRRAQSAAQQFSARNVEFRSADVGEFLRTGKFAKPSLVVVDPARAGLDRLAREQLKLLLPKQIIYVSCSPSTLRRDLLDFQTAGYTILSVRGFDMFPHTGHIEVLVNLARR